MKDYRPIKVMHVTSTLQCVQLLERLSNYDQIY